jgi:probable rRNA maturation factor
MMDVFTLRPVPVRLVVEGGPWRGLPRALVERRARAMLVALGIPDAEWSIVLTGDERVRELNRVYRKKDKPTDVLAFPQDDGSVRARSPSRPSPGGPGRASAPTLLGDVVVSVPTAARQAAAAGHELAAEVTMLLAHGLLHLRGWDHDTVARDRRMRAETGRLCKVAERAFRLRSSKSRW